MKEFWQINCFTTQPFCGNPAAVVFDCDDKSAQWMQAVSREMNLSETVFFVKPTKSDADDEFASIRKSAIAFFDALDDAALIRNGVTDGHRVTVRALAYHIAGHELRHMNVIRERYL